MLPLVSDTVMDLAAPWYWTLRDRVADAFELEFHDLVAFHRVHIGTYERMFEQAADNARATLDPEYHDEGDVFAAAEAELGTEPRKVAQHLGLLVLIRGVSLAEITIAKTAAIFFTDAEGVVFTNGKAWTRQTAKLFYSSMLERPYDIDGFGMDAIAELRNTYAHGYGTFKTRADAEALERRLLSIVEPASGPTAEEDQAGYGTEHSVLGRYAGSYSDLLDPEAHLSPLTVYRLLGVIQRTVAGALAAAAWGLKDESEVARSKFAKDWMRRHPDGALGQRSLTYEGAVEIRSEGKRVLLEDGAGDQVNLVELMADGLYRARIELGPVGSAGSAD